MCSLTGILAFAALHDAYRFLRSDEPFEMKDDLMYTLRPATPADHEPLRQIHHAAFHDCVSALWGWDEVVQDSMWDSFIQTAILQVIEVDGQSVGYLEVNREPDHIFVANIALDPVMHGRGIGTRILQDILAEADTTASPVRLDVIKTNTRARALYERLEFVWIGENESHDTMEHLP